MNDTNVTTLTKAVLARIKTSVEKNTPTSFQDHFQEAAATHGLRPNDPRFRRLRNIVGARVILLLPVQSRPWDLGQYYSPFSETRKEGKSQPRPEKPRMERKMLALPQRDRE